MKFARRNHIEDVVELNITAFLNLMVILVPFLLITAVFSRLTILELNLPVLDAIARQEGKVKLQLELIIRDNSIEVQDARLGLIKQYLIEKNEINWTQFTEMLVEIKTRFPDEKSITLLLEPGINYKTMIQVMDHVRGTEVVKFTSLESVELFPNISIGDAPELESQKDNISNIINKENPVNSLDSGVPE